MVWELQPSGELIGLRITNNLSDIMKIQGMCTIREKTKREGLR
jgi:hypothetical protein